MPATTNRAMIKVSTATFILTEVRMAAAARSVTMANARPAVRPHCFISYVMATSKGMLQNVPMITSQ